MRTTRLRVTLREVEPVVMRMIDVPQDSTLTELHDLLQVAVGFPTATCTSSPPRTRQPTELRAIATTGWSSATKPSTT